MVELLGMVLDFLDALGWRSGDRLVVVHMGQPKQEADALADQSASQRRS